MKEEMTITKKLQQLLKLSRTPLSKFQVACIIIDDEGKEYQGVNIEHPSYKDGLCAEQVALNDFFTNRKNKKIKIKEINIMSSHKTQYIYPCFLCREYLFELAPKTAIINCYTRRGKVEKHTINDFCPLPFIYKEEK